MEPADLPPEDPEQVAGRDRRRIELLLQFVAGLKQHGFGLARALEDLLGREAAAVALFEHPVDVALRGPHLPAGQGVQEPLEHLDRLGRPLHRPFVRMAR